jgi:hypothetical protein
VDVIANEATRVAPPGLRSRSLVPDSSDQARTSALGVAPQGELRVTDGDMIDIAAGPERVGDCSTSALPGTMG